MAFSLIHLQCNFCFQMLLNVKRGFILKADGTYDDIEPCDIQEGVAKREGEATIRPVDFKTYLKIGKFYNIFLRLE